MTIPHRAPQPSGARPAAGAAGELQEDRRVGRRDLTSWRTSVGRAAATAVHRLARVLGPHSALIITLSIGLAIAVALSAVSAEIYDAVKKNDDVAIVDRPVLDFMISIRTPFGDAAVTAFTDIAGTIGMPLIAVAAILILALTRRSWTPVILIVAAGGGSLLMTIAGKDLIGRARPPLVDAVPPYEYSPSFPSGHSLNALVIAGVIAYLLVLRQRSRSQRIVTVSVAALFAILVGMSRVYLGHHWVTDVLAAWTLGIAWLALVITAHRLYLTARHREGIPAQAPSDS